MSVPSTHACSCGSAAIRAVEALPQTFETFETFETFKTLDKNATEPATQPPRRRLFQAPDVATVRRIAEELGINCYVTCWSLEMSAWYCTWWDRVEVCIPPVFTLDHASVDAINKVLAAHHIKQTDEAFGWFAVYHELAHAKQMQHITPYNFWAHRRQANREYWELARQLGYNASPSPSSSVSSSSPDEFDMQQFTHFLGQLPSWERYRAQHLYRQMPSEREADTFACEQIRKRHPELLEECT